MAFDMHAGADHQMIGPLQDAFPTLMWMCTMTAHRFAATGISLDARTAVVSGQVRHQDAPCSVFKQSGVF